MKLLKKTKSLCPECFKEIDAIVYQKDNDVYMKKKCSAHGKWVIRIEKNAKFYIKIINKQLRKNEIEPIDLMLPITHRCNLDCKICYLPYTKKEPSLKYLKRVIDHFKGDIIKISGGEPTLRQDVLKLIKYVNKKRKKSYLITNGINLSKEKYVKLLKSVCLNLVSVPLNSMSDEISQRIEGRKILNYKLKEIENLKKNKIKMVLGTIVLKGVNEGELEKIFKYYIANHDLITRWRVRSEAKFGKYYADTEQLCLSEIINELCKVISKVCKIRISIDDITKNFNKKENLDSAPCKFTLFLIFSKNKKGMNLLGVETNESNLTKLRNSKYKKLSAGFKLIKQGGVINLMKYLSGKFLSEENIVTLPISIRCWPNKYTIDLNELRYCSSRNLGEDGKILPHCYSLILNEKFDI